MTERGEKREAAINLWLSLSTSFSLSFTWMPENDAFTAHITPPKKRREEE